MKKILSLILAVLMILSLCACGKEAGNGSGGGDNAGEVGVFKVGYHAVNITPVKQGVPMNGYGNAKERLSTGFLTYIYAISIAVTDAEGNTAILTSVDIAAVGVETIEEVRQWASATYKIPKENIVISAIHQHSCPDGYVKDNEASAAFLAQLTKGLKDSMTKALEDRAPAEMYINTATTDALSFVRHYIANDPAGSIVGDNYNDAIGSQYGYKKHESESDKEMRMIKFTREGDKKDIILVNFQAHPHMGAGAKSTDIHADWPGVMRETVAKELNCDVIYFSGAGGNLNSTSRISEENVTDCDFRKHGEKAAQYVIDAESSYEKVATGKVQAKEMKISCEADHSMDHLYEQAKIVHNARSISLAEANKVLKNYPKLHSVYHATAVVDKYQKGKTVDTTIGAIVFGDVAFTVHNYEMFDTNGMELRAGSLGHENEANYEEADRLANPYKMTIIATIANSNGGHIPSRLGYTNGGYSTDITDFAPGTGEKLVGDYLRILNELHG